MNGSHISLRTTATKKTLMALNLKYTTTDPLALEPSRFQDNSATYNLFALKDIIVPPKSVIKVNTGIILEMQGSFFGLISDEIELATKKNLKIIAGVIDPSYRGVILVTFFNLSNEEQKIFAQEKIAHILFLRVLLPKFIYAEEIDDIPEIPETCIRYTKTRLSAFEPRRFEEGSVGYDLHALKDLVIPANGSGKVDTGIILNIQGPMYGQLFDKSGFVTQKKLHVVGGVIDSSYRSSIEVHFINLSDKEQRIFADEKIAQIVFLPIELPTLVYKKEIDMNTIRKQRGFGGHVICDDDFLK